MMNCLNGKYSPITFERQEDGGIATYQNLLEIHKFKHGGEVLEFPTDRLYKRPKRQEKITKEDLEKIQKIEQDRRKRVAHIEKLERRTAKLRKALIEANLPIWERIFPNSTEKVMSLIMATQKRWKRSRVYSHLKDLCRVLRYGDRGGFKFRVIEEDRNYRLYPNHGLTVLFPNIVYEDLNWKGKMRSWCIALIAFASMLAITYVMAGWV
jgi:hypothetical protein